MKDKERTRNHHRSKKSRKYGATWDVEMDPGTEELLMEELGEIQYSL
jgi:hypothetical protein